MKFNKQTEGVTLIELMIALVISGVIMIAATSSLQFMYNLHIEQEFYKPSVIGSRVSEMFFTRVLHANQFQIKDNGRSIEFRIAEDPGTTRWAKLSKGQDNVLYYDKDINDSEVPEIVVKGVKDVIFAQDFGNRASIELILMPPAEDIFTTACKGLSSFVGNEAFAVENTDSELTIRTSVRARNIPIPRARIN